MIGTMAHLDGRREAERKRLRGLSDRLPELNERELEDARALWWALARSGDRLPAEAGVILIRGGLQ